MKLKVKPKHIVIISGVAIASGLGIAIAVTSLGSKDNLELKTPYLSYELGYQDVNIGQDELLAGEMKGKSRTKLTSELLTNTSKYKYDEVTNVVKSLNLDYLTKGIYKIGVELKGQSEEVIVFVKDSYAPMFTNLYSELIVEENAIKDINELADFFNIDDFDLEAEFAVIANGVNLNKAGEYLITAIGYDTSGNYQEIKVPLKVIPSKDAQLRPEVLTVNRLGVIPATDETVKKIGKEFFQFSEASLNYGYDIRKGIVLTEDNAYNNLIQTLSDKKQMSLDEEETYLRKMGIDPSTKEEDKETKKRIENERAGKQLEDQLKVQDIIAERNKDVENLREIAKQKTEIKKEEVKRTEEQINEDYKKAFDNYQKNQTPENKAELDKQNIARVKAEQERIAQEQAEIEAEKIALNRAIESNKDIKKTTDKLDESLGLAKHIANSTFYIDEKTGSVKDFKQLNSIKLEKYPCTTEYIKKLRGEEIDAELEKLKNNQKEVDEYNKLIKGIYNQYTNVEKASTKVKITLEKAEKAYKAGNIASFKTESKNARDALNDYMKQMDGLGQIIKNREDIVAKYSNIWGIYLYIEEGIINLDVREDFNKAEELGEYYRKALNMDVLKERIKTEDHGFKYIEFKGEEEKEHRGLIAGNKLLVPSPLIDFDGEVYEKLYVYQLKDTIHPMNVYGRLRTIMENSYDNRKGEHPELYADIELLFGNKNTKYYTLEDVNKMNSESKEIRQQKGWTDSIADSGVGSYPRGIRGEYKPFDTLEDAMFAKEVLNDVITDMFKTVRGSLDTFDHNEITIHYVYKKEEDSKNKKTIDDIPVNTEREKKYIAEHKEKNKDTDRAEISAVPSDKAYWTCEDGWYVFWQGTFVKPDEQHPILEANNDTDFGDLYYKTGAYYRNTNKE